MQQLSTKDRGAISKASLQRVRIPSTVLKIVDAMSTLSGILASGEVRFTATSTIIHTVTLTGCTMFEQGLSDILHAEESTKGRGRCERCARAV